MTDPAIGPMSMETFDACVIGSGPVGLASALTLAEQGLSVALVESGFESDDAPTQALSDACIETPLSHAPMNHAVRRALGGTSAWWGGRCVPLDEVDYLMRAHVPRSGWPLSMQEANEHLDAACQFLGAGPARFSVRSCPGMSSAHQMLSEKMVDSAALRSTDLERWSGAPNAWQAHRQAVLKSGRIRVLKGHTCVGWIQAVGGNVSEALLKTSPSAAVTSLKARFHVLAAGGVESTRLVLHSAQSPHGLRPDNTTDVGRHYMGHPSGKLVTIRFHGDPDQTLYGFEQDAGAYVRRRLTLSRQTQLEHGLLNIAFWTDNPPLADASHGSGILSAAYLALTAPVLGPRLAPAAIRARVAGEQSVKRLPHLMNCIKSPLATLAFSTSFAWKRYGAKPRLPGFFTKSSSNTYALHFHAEHAPNPDSRITLTDDLDAMGVPRARIKLNWRDEDIDAILKAHEVLGQALESKGIGTLKHLYPPDQRKAAIIEQAIDGFHQIGTLRMAHNSQEGVTNAHGKLFGSTNFYIAGSALFPTSGQANPTLVAVSLAMRQAHHIASQSR